MQGMHLGDVRFARALVRTTLEVDRPVYAAFGKNMKEVLTEYMEKEGISWDYIMREKEKNEKFTWDIVDRGVKKQTLRDLYEKIESGQFDSKSMKIKIKTDNYDISNITEPGAINTEEDAIYWYLIKYKISSEYEIVPNTHLKSILHRAVRSSGFPLATAKVIFFCDRGAKNWYGGYDFFLCGVKRKVSKDDVIALNPYIEPHMILLSYLDIDSKPRQILKRYVGVYEVITDVDVEQLKEEVEEFEKAKEVIVTNLETRYFSGRYKKRVDLKSPNVYYEFNNIRSINGTREGQFELKLNVAVGIRYFLKGVLDRVSFNRILKFEIRKIGFDEKIDNGDITKKLM